MRAAALVAVLFVCVASAVAQPCATTKFDTPPAHYGGPEPRTLALANLNGDQWPDAIAGSFDLNPATRPIGGLTLLAGHRGGNWSVLAEREPTGQVYHVAAGDFDGDGDDDIAYSVTTLDGAREIRVLRNDNPGFSAASSYAVSVSQLGGFAAGDFNGDEREDLVFTSPGDFALLLLSRGDGTFTTSRLSAGTSYAPAAADLNGDGFDDLVLGDSFAAQVLLYAGDASGLQSGVAVPLHDRAADLAIGDFDGSGTLDVVIMHEQRVTFDTIYDAARAEQHVSPEPALLFVLSFARAAVGDLDRNGADDMVWFDFRGLDTAFFGVADEPVAGDGWFVPGRVSGGYRDRDVDIADLDADGDLDVVVVTEDGLRTFLNDGTGAFDAPKFATRVRAVGDFNHDGRDDLVDHESLLIADENGEFTSMNQRAGYEDQTVAGVATGDVSGDGNLDIVRLVLDFTYRVVVRRGLGNGALRAPQELVLTRNAEHMLVRDFTGDGRDDLLITNDVSLASLYVSLGDGTFGPEQTVPDVRGRHAEAGDVDGDGDLDVVTDRVFLNDGTGHFTPVEPPGTGLVFDPVHEVADLNGDGRDNVVLHLFDGEVRVFLSTGGGEFELLHTLDTGIVDIHDFDVRDFNADGHADLLVTEGDSTAAGGWLKLYFGDGTGHFPRSMRMRSAAVEAFAGDFNGDRLVDLVDAGYVRLAECARPKGRAARH